MVKRTNDAAQEESKETVGFVAEDSKGDSVPFGTRLSGESLVCYTFMKQTEYGNDECPVEARSISVFFLCERLIPQREKLEQRKGTGEVTYVTEPVPARSAE